MLFCVALVLSGSGARFAIVEGFTPPDRSRDAKTHCDVVMLKKGIDATPRLRDTAKWWTGYWIGCNPFWRPLSSYAFWGMYKTLGWEHQDRYEIVTAACHIAACALLFLLIEAVTGRTLAALIGVWFLNLRIPVKYLDRMTEAPGLAGVSHWIYLPDVWLALCVLPALLTAWRGRPWWALVFATLAAGFKETGFVTFPLVMVFYWWRWRRLDRSFIALIAVAGGLAAVRLIGVGPGWILGSNASMWMRMFRFACGYPLTMLTGAQAPWAVLGIGMAIAIIGWRSRWLRYGGPLAGLFLAALAYWSIVYARGELVSYTLSIVALMEWKYIIILSGRVALWIAVVYAGLRSPDRSLIFLFIVAYLVLGLPAKIAPQSGERSLYNAYMMSATAKALCLWWAPGLFLRPQAAREISEDSEDVPASDA